MPPKSPPPRPPAPLTWTASRCSADASRPKRSSASAWRTEGTKTDEIDDRRRSPSRAERAIHDDAHRVATRRSRIPESSIRRRGMLRVSARRSNRRASHRRTCKARADRGCLTASSTMRAHARCGSRQAAARPRETRRRCGISTARSGICVGQGISETAPRHGRPQEAPAFGAFLTGRACQRRIAARCLFCLPRRAFVVQ